MAERGSSAQEEKKKGKEAEEAPAKEPTAKSNGSTNGRKEASLPPPPPSRASALPAPGDSNAELPRPDIEGDKTPSLPPLPAAGPWRSYKEIVSQLAQRIVDAQRPIRVLQSIRWDASIGEQFQKTRYRELPKADAAFYEKVDLSFDPRVKVAEFEEIARDIDRELGEADAVGNIMLTTAIQYRDLVRMLEARGTPTFYAYSRKLYGSPKDKFPDGKTTVRELGHVLYEILTNTDETSLGDKSHIDRRLTAGEAAEELARRFTGYFGENGVRVQLDDGILSDAAAGGDCVKVRSAAMFSQRDIDVLEVHEGWVHVATSLNGQSQTVARWLSKGPPRTTTVQEGLAALLEIFTFRTHPRRARRLNDRVLAVDKAEDGASFIDVFEWFRTEGYSEEECFANTRRIFRGGVVEGGAPFTKDACYCKGIVLNYAFIRSAFLHNRADLIPYLFVGKVAHEDVAILARRVADGVVKPPLYVPPMFKDLNGLSIWMAYSSFFSRLANDAILEHYGKLFARAG
jgi:uncharacterized protein (TIGR02421 family)